MSERARSLLESMYQAAVRAADPRDAVRAALARDAEFGERPTRLIALGKAAGAMTDAAIESLALRGASLSGGVLVTTHEFEPPHAALTVVAGAHPIPDEHSFAAARAIADAIARVGPGDDALVLISGGATSLAAAPIAAIAESTLVQCFDGLLGSGADIVAMNAIRKRLVRWGGGRLAVALAERGVERVTCLIVSDVLGDDPVSIASGPCCGDAMTASDVLALIDRQGLEAFVPLPIREHLHAVARGEADETPKPGDPRLARVRCEIVLGNGTARAAAAACARELGLEPVKLVDVALDDDAAYTGERLVDELIRFREASVSGTDACGCIVWGGETTVRLGAFSSALGGRCQELALSAAFALCEANERGHGITLLAAGTDGRDGPTDAAGAVVDASTWDALRRAGRDPERDLIEHESHRALDSGSALLRTGATGTNVGDVVIGLADSREEQR